MERKMNKSERKLSLEDTLTILKKAKHGTLSVNGDDGYPYATPVNYVVRNDKVYIHSAQYGYKIDCLKQNSKCCFSAIISAEVIPSKITAAYESVIITGHVTFVEERAEKEAALKAFVTDLCTGHEEVGFMMAEAAYDKAAILRIDPVEVSGKAWKDDQN